MKQKIRIFVIDKEYEQEMKDDLANDDLMQFYWTHTGKSVKTYWITTDDMQCFYGSTVDISRDFALYDEELLIEYDSSTSTLFFDIIKCSDERHEIFHKLAEQEKNRSSEPFIKVEPKEA